MRLNFAGVTETDIAEAIRRIGKVVNEQVALFGTLTGAEQPSAQDENASPSASTAREGLADVVAFPIRGDETARRRRDR
jgi:2-aminoadipate transaminase